MTHFRYGIIILLLIYTHQSEGLAQSSAGSLKVNPVIEQMLQGYVKTQQLHQVVPGFRVQIAQDSNREAARTEKTSALTKFPQWEVYEQYDSPAFKIRVGDFKTRIAAYKALRDLKIVFKRAFIVEDRIQLSKAQ